MPAIAPAFFMPDQGIEGRRQNFLPQKAHIATG
jgi:hypothetical protein